jgi:hypothetical protein
MVVGGSSLVFDSYRTDVNCRLTAVVTPFSMALPQPPKLNTTNDVQLLILGAGSRT